MAYATAMLGLLAETSIHAGAGDTVGVIDLPIQREAHTGWPCIYGSAVKGAMRAQAEGDEKNKDWITEVFGPDTNNASDHAGALTVGDARLLLLPVRSLTTHFKWVACPALLRRFQADCQRHGLTAQAKLEIPDVAGDQALLPQGQDYIFLEEFRFTPKKNLPALEKNLPALEKKSLDNLIDALATVFPDPEAKKLLQNQLVLVSNDRFAHLSRYATPVNPHIAINSERKTVIDGALWYEETLPPDTLLYVTLFAQNSRKPESSGKDRDKVLSHITDGLFPDSFPYLQLGGNETTGMGWCRVKKLKPGEQ